MQVIEETGETVVATRASLQLWSINGALLACTPARFDSSATALCLLHAPEWMVEQLPIAATGHADGSVRFWSVREPLSGAALGSGGALGSAAPRALSCLPVRSEALPAWELYEVSSLRLDAHANGGGGGEGGPGANGGGGGGGGASGAALLPESELAVIALCVGEGYEQLLWTATADGRLRSWKASPAAAASSPNIEAAPADEVGSPTPERVPSMERGSMEANPPPPSPIGSQGLSTEMGT